MNRRVWVCTMNLGANYQVVGVDYSLSGILGMLEERFNNGEELTLPSSKIIDDCMTIEIEDVQIGERTFSITEWDMSSNDDFYEED